MPDYDEIAKRLTAVAPKYGVDPSDTGKLTQVGLKFAKKYNPDSFDPVKLNDSLLKLRGVDQPKAEDYSITSEMGRRLGEFASIPFSAGEQVTHGIVKLGEALNEANAASGVPILPPDVGGGYYAPQTQMPASQSVPVENRLSTQLGEPVFPQNTVAGQLASGVLPFRVGLTPVAAGAHMGGQAARFSDQGDDPRLALVKAAPYAAADVAMANLGGTVLPGVKGLVGAGALGEATAFGSANNTEEGLQAMVDPLTVAISTLPVAAHTVPSAASAIAGKIQERKILAAQKAADEALISRGIGEPIPVDTIRGRDVAPDPIDQSSVIPVSYADELNRLRDEEAAAQLEAETAPKPTALRDIVAASRLDAEVGNKPKLKPVREAVSAETIEVPQSASEVNDIALKQAQTIRSVVENKQLAPEVRDNLINRVKTWRAESLAAIARGEPSLPVPKLDELGIPSERNIQAETASMQQRQAVESDATRPMREAKAESVTADVQAEIRRLRDEVQALRQERMAPAKQAQQEAIAADTSVKAGEAAAAPDKQLIADADKAIRKAEYEATGNTSPSGVAMQAPIGKQVEASRSLTPRKLEKRTDTPLARDSTAIAERPVATTPVVESPKPVETLQPEPVVAKSEPIVPEAPKSVETAAKPTETEAPAKPEGKANEEVRQEASPQQTPKEGEVLGRKFYADDTAAAGYREVTDRVDPKFYEGKDLVSLDWIRANDPKGEKRASKLERQGNSVTNTKLGRNNTRSGAVLIPDISNAVKTIKEYVVGSKAEDTITRISAAIGQLRQGNKRDADIVSNMVRNGNILGATKYAEDRVLIPNSQELKRLSDEGYATSKFGMTVQKVGGEYRAVVRPLFVPELREAQLAKIGTLDNPNSIRSKARDGLMRDMGLTKDEADKRIFDYVSEGFTPDQIQTSRMGPVKSGHEKSRIENMPQYLDDLFGRVSDPGERLIHTVAISQRITENKLFRERFHNEGLAEGFVTDKIPSGDGWIELPEGGYVRSDVAALMRNANQNPSKFMAALNRFVRIKNTINVAGQGIVQPIMGGIDLAGNVLTYAPLLGKGDISKIGKSLRRNLTPDMLKSLSQLVEQADVTKQGRVQAHNVINPLDDLLGRNKPNIVDKSLGVLQKPMTAIDNVNREFVSIAMESQIRRNNPTWTEKQIQSELQDRINNLTVTPQNAWKFVRTLHKYPLLANYATYMTEMVRTRANLVRYIASDFKGSSTESKVRALAMAGIGTGIAALPAVLEAMSMNELDINPEQDAKFRTTHAYTKTTRLYYFKDKNGKLDAINIGRIDPLSWPTGIWKAFTSPEPLEAKDIAPFLVNSIVTTLQSASNDVANGRKGKALETLATSIMPSNIKQGYAEEGVSGAAKAFTTSNLGESLNESEARKVSTTGTPTTLRSKTIEAKNLDKFDKSDLYRELRNPSDKRDQTKIRESATKMMKSQEDNWDKVIADVKARLDQGDKASDIAKDLSELGVTNSDVSNIIRGKRPEKKTVDQFVIAKRVDLLRSDAAPWQQFDAASGNDRKELLKTYTKEELKKSLRADRVLDRAKEIQRRADKLGDKLDESKAKILNGQLDQIEKLAE